MSRPPGRKPITKEMREARRKAAEERNASWAKLDPAAQLAILDDRHGVGLGAGRQRKRIAKALRASRLGKKP